MDEAYRLLALVRARVDAEHESLNTLAGAVIVLDKLANRAPMDDETVFSKNGQIAGERGSKFRDTLSRWGISPHILSDGVTTRSTSVFQRLLEPISKMPVDAKIEA